MIFTTVKNTLLLWVFLGISCGKGVNTDTDKSTPALQPAEEKTVTAGANSTGDYIPLLTHKKVGIVANATSVIRSPEKSYVHVVDSLLALNIALTKVFAPEHGFRGTADAGEVIKDGTDPKTGLPIISLYGNNKKPTETQLADLDIVIFDLQDVGARFYTYISTLHYVMEACAEAGIPLMVLDRPNPNGHYVDGPVLHPEYRSFVGMHPVPVVHGMTIGEYAQMINGEGWLESGKQCELTVIPVKNYDHNTAYSLPVKPSPNLPNDKAVNLYPSLCFFEGTNVSAGRGTDKQFQIYGAPSLPEGGFKFVPEPNEGARHPKHEGKTCYGEDLRTTERLDRIRLGWLIKAYENTADKARFFNSFFDKLAGNPELQRQIKSGMSGEDIRKSWETGLEAFKKIRKKYLIYDDTL